MQDERAAKACGRIHCYSYDDRLADHCGAVDANGKSGPSGWCDGYDPAFGGVNQSHQPALRDFSHRCANCRHARFPWVPPRFRGYMTPRGKCEHPALRGLPVCVPTAIETHEGIVCPAWEPEDIPASGNLPHGSEVGSAAVANAELARSYSIETKSQSGGGCHEPDA